MNPPFLPAKPPCRHQSPLTPSYYSTLTGNPYPLTAYPHWGAIKQSMPPVTTAACAIFLSLSPILTLAAWRDCVKIGPAVVPGLAGHLLRCSLMSLNGLQMNPRFKFFSCRLLIHSQAKHLPPLVCPAPLINTSTTSRTIVGISLPGVSPALIIPSYSGYSFGSEYPPQNRIAKHWQPY